MTQDANLSIIEYHPALSYNAFFCQVNKGLYMKFKEAILSELKLWGEEDAQLQIEPELTTLGAMEELGLLTQYFPTPILEQSVNQQERFEYPYQTLDLAEIASLAPSEPKKITSFAAIILAELKLLYNEEKSKNTTSLHLWPENRKRSHDGNDSFDDVKRQKPESPLLSPSMSPDPLDFLDYDYSELQELPNKDGLKSRIK